VEVPVATTLSPDAVLSPDALKARFKQKCLETNGLFQNWQIRVHRSLSWSKRAMAFADDQPEARFLYLWIALNSLYSRWNNEKNAPDGDGPARRDFAATVCTMDGTVVGQLMAQSRGLVRKLLENPFLSEVFWREPDNPKAKGRATQDANYLERNLRNGDCRRLLEQVLERLFVLRGQMVHGASTGGSRLNRNSVKYSLQMLALLVPLIQQIVIEHGGNDDWPELCYPPIA
jgi:hypothetical protein